MDSESSVPLEIVLRVLSAHGVDVFVDPDHGGHAIKLAKGDLLEVVVLTDPVCKRMLQRFQRVFGVPIYRFYNPEMGVWPKPNRVQ